MVVKNEENIELSRGGNTTKIHAVCDAQGNPIRFILTVGNEADCSQALYLLGGLLQMLYWQIRFMTAKQ